MSLITDIIIFSRCCLSIISFIVSTWSHQLQLIISSVYKTLSRDWRRSSCLLSVFDAPALVDLYLLLNCTSVLVYLFVLLFTLFPSLCLLLNPVSITLTRRCGEKVAARVDPPTPVLSVIYVHTFVPNGRSNNHSLAHATDRFPRHKQLPTRRCSDPGWKGIPVTLRLRLILTGECTSV